MQKIEFKNLPNTDTPITAENLNAIQDNVENEINDSSVVVSTTEPTENRKKVWMKKSATKGNAIYIKNDNDVYEEFISKEKILGDDILNNFYGFKKEYYDGKTIDCNDMVSSGIYILDINNTISNKPNSLNNNVNALLVIQTQKESIVLQIWFNYNSALYYRWKWWGTWGSWKQITIS